MISRTQLASTIFALSLTISVNGPSFAAPVVGTSAAVSGNVYVSTRGAERKAQVRDSIKLQDKIVTKDNSALQILLLDRTTFTVGQNCSMVIDKFVYDPTTTTGQVSAKVAKGAFRFMSGRIGKNNPTNASVSTPSATIGIRGTFFEGVVGEDAVALAQLGGVNTAGSVLSQASAIVLRGPGRRRNSLDRPGTIVVSNAGGSIRISQPDYVVYVPSANASPIGPFKLTDDMREYLNFFLRTTPNGQSENPQGIVKKGSEESGQAQFELPAEPIDPFLEELEEADRYPSGRIAVPVVPVIPVVPVTPVVPVIPVVPVTPVVPETPVTPETSVIPEEPVVPETPETPETPNASVVLVAPPTDPSDPSDPSTPPCGPSDECG